MKLLFVWIPISLIAILGCQKKDITVAKDYTSIVCKVHNERVYKREHSGATVDYKRSYGQFLLSQDWRAKYPYAIINSNKDIHTDGEAKQFHYHLVCDRCQSEFRREAKGFNPKSKDLRFAIILDDLGRPFVDGNQVSMDHLESMLIAAVAKQPSVEVTITVPHSLPFKHERAITRAVYKSGVKYLKTLRSPKAIR